MPPPGLRVGWRSETRQTPPGARPNRRAQPRFAGGRGALPSPRVGRMSRRATGGLRWMTVAAAQAAVQNSAYRPPRWRPAERPTSWPHTGKCQYMRAGLGGIPDVGVPGHPGHPGRRGRRPLAAAMARSTGAGQAGPSPPSGSPRGRPHFTRSEHGDADPGVRGLSGHPATLRPGHGRHRRGSSERGSLLPRQGPLRHGIPGTHEPGRHAQTGGCLFTRSELLPAPGPTPLHHVLARC